ncbi:MAG: CinA family nicotinamide mononucleotide deamidase-related protein [Bacteroidota bacterium]
MTVFLLSIGDELLIGQVVDTNSAWIGEQLTAIGHTVVEKMAVADTREGILAGVARGLSQADLVICTGGLGPTKDDVTISVLAEYFNDELALHEPTWERMQRFFKKFGREAKPAHREQCYLPSKADILENSRGTAPGMWLENEKGQAVVSLPGVPYEVRALIREQIIPRLESLRQDDQDHLVFRTILTAGEGESWIAERLSEFEDGLPAHIKLAYLPHLGTVRLRLTASGPDRQQLDHELDQYRDRAVDLLGRLVFGYGNQTLSEVVGDLLHTRGAMLTTAESCTGGRIANIITSRPGSSAYFAGGVVSYANELKINLLGVDPALIEQHGAVSEPVVKAMAEGVIRTTGAQYSIATSGVAGPGGGTPDKPVGTIWLAVSDGQTTKTRLLKAGKDRKRNIEYTALRALNELRLFLEA